MQKRTGILTTTIGLALLGYTVLSNQPSKTNHDQPPLISGKGSLHNLDQAYQKWASGYSKIDRPGPTIGLTWNKGLSTEFSKAKGIAQIDLTTATVSINISGLEDEAVSEVWLVDNQQGLNRTIRPEPGDTVLHIGSLNFDKDNATLEKQLDKAALASTEADWIVLTRKGSSPLQGGVLYGSTSLFQKIYHYPDQSPLVASNSRLNNDEFNFISPVAASGITPGNYPNAYLINAGRRIFFNETFRGNGRTCGTCHPADNNFTIDPKFIATLPDSSPLFLAERAAPNPLSNNFEKPELMRKVGLILENTNGFGDLANSFTMRSVPHVLAMRTSLSPPSPAANDGTNTPPDERTGWSGDGSPTNLAISPQLRGTLRDFSVGAVTQHFTKTLNRTAGTDFRLPSEFELDALEAFMLSLGRQDEYDDFTQITLADPRGDQGRKNYMGENVVGALNCNACHFNGGANTDPNFNFPASVTPAAFELTNRSFAPRVEELIDQPGDIVDASNNPFDDGFGADSSLFNVPVVVEAADTGPFFHANQIDTVEAMIAFYATQRHLRNGEVLAPIIGLNGSQVANIGAFLRIINADENARSAISLIDKASQIRRRRARKHNLHLARAEIKDAIEVLEGGNLHFDDAVPLLKKAYRLSRWRYTMRQAKTKLEAVREIMINR
jgi:cytochrome c peroxidase